MQFLRVKGWAKYQHYKDRNPPWIKLHRELLTSLTWAMADDASRVLAIACMMLAAATDNKIPFDSGYIKRVAYLNSEPDFSQLLKLEFLEVIDDKGQVVITAITPLADASKMQAHARPETEAETEHIQKKQKLYPQKPADVLPLDSRHIRIKSLICNAYAQQNGVDCPWDGGEGKQLKAFLDCTPRWMDSQVAQCLVNMYDSGGFAKGTRPREFLPRLPKYLNGPLNEFNREQTNGTSKGDRKAADISKTTREVFGSGGIVHGNDSARLQVKAASAGAGAVAGHSQGLLVSGIQSGNDPPDK